MNQPGPIDRDDDRDAGRRESGSGGNPVVVVTGASAGVGRATAIAFGARRANVVLLARGRAGLEAAAGDVEAAGGRALSIVADVADGRAVHDAASAAEGAFGPIDVWVNNAMATVFAPVRDTTIEEFDRVTAVTYLGQVHGTMAALARMRARDRGTVVNVGSALAYRAIPLQAAYCGAKFAVRGFTEAVRAELIAEGSHVRITEVHLPAINTPQFGWCRSKLERHPRPVPPIYQPEVAAALIVAATDRDRRARVLGAWTRMIIEASKVAPGVLDHFAARTSIDGQLAPPEVAPDPSDGLFAPADDEPGSDRGVHGIFDASAGGLRTPGFLATVPRMGLEVAAAAVDRLRRVLA